MQINEYKGCIKMTKVFVDGSSGTTGLKILDRLAIRNDVELIKLDEALRKDVNAKAEEHTFFLSKVQDYNLSQ